MPPDDTNKPQVPVDPNAPVVPATPVAPVDPMAPPAPVVENPAAPVELPKEETPSADQGGMPPTVPPATGM